MPTHACAKAHDGTPDAGKDHQKAPVISEHKWLQTPGLRISKDYFHHHPKSVDHIYVISVLKFFFNNS